MKRANLVNLICSAIIIISLAIAAVVAVMFFGADDGKSNNKIVISSASSVAVYDGKALTNESWKLIDGELKDGHVLSVSVNGTQTNVGISENFISATILDENGRDVTRSYNIEYKPGSLNVKPRSITLIADSEIKLYDGEPLKSNEYDIESPLSLVDGHRIDVKIRGSITDIGITDNIITKAVITDENGEDVTKNYNITTVNGKLAVYSQDTLVFESDSSVRPYTGQPLTDSDWKMTSGNLLPGDNLHVVVTGAQTIPGTSENSISVAIKDFTGRDVTNRYELLLLPGTLTVMSPTVTVTSGSAQKVFDGTPLIDSTYKLSPDYFNYISGISVDVKLEGSQTEVGESENTIASVIIRDENGKDITELFDIKYDPGTLTVVPADEALLQEITFSSKSASKQYDGEALVNTNWIIESGALRTGDVAQVTFLASQTEVGSIDNQFSVEIFDEYGNLVTDKYLIRTLFGTLTVSPAEVTVTSDDANKVFDGKELTCHTFKVNPVFYNENFRFELDIVGKRIDVGASPNTIASCRVYNDLNEDVTSNFNITKQEGTLTVTELEEDLKNVLVYESGSASKVYDGTPLYNGECNRVSGELLPEHREVIVLNSSITNVGKIDNEIKVSIYCGDVDVTGLYIINCMPGTLEVTKRPLTITSASDEKVYDGKPLQNSNITVAPEDSLIPGHNLNVSVVGSITQPGTSENTISSWAIFDGDGIDVSDFYDVTIEHGTLIVMTDEGGSGSGEGGSGSGEGGSGSGEGDSGSGEGDSGSGEGGSGSGEGGSGSGEGGSSSGEGGSLDLSGGLGGSGGGENNTVYFSLVAEEDGRVYLKIMNYGDYLLNDGWGNAPKYELLTGDGRSAFYLTALALQARGYDTEKIKIIPQSNYVALPYHTIDSNLGIQLDDTKVSGSCEAPYDVSYFVYDGKKATSFSTDFLLYEHRYRDFVKQNYLNVDSETLALMNKIIKENGFSKDDPEIIQKIARYIQNAAEYNLDYNQQLDSEGNIVVAFLTKYKEGVCRHYASAATLLFRALGIPARYTVGFAANVKAGKQVDVLGSSYHAWTEVYIDGMGWVDVEVTGGTSSEQPADKDFDPSGKIGQNNVDNSKVYFSVKGQNNDKVYFKIKSFGDFADGNSWSSAVEYLKRFDSNKSAYFLVATALKNSGLETTQLSIIPNGCFTLPYYSLDGNFNLLMANDVAIKGNIDKDYTVNYFIWNATSGAVLPSAYRDFEAAYAEFVEENYLSLDSETLSFMLNIIEKEGFSASDPDIISKVLKYIRGSAKYDRDYNKALDSESNVVIAFLSNYQRGVSEHYASAATLLYRALGIPARYTLGFVANVQSGNSIDVKGADFCAWVEVYVDGIGWIRVDPTPSREPKTLIVSPSAVREKYDPMVHSPQNPLLPTSTLSGLSSLVAEGYTYQAYVSGQNYELGIQKSTIETLRIFDKFGELVYDKETGFGSDEFIITYAQGDIQLYYSALTFESKSYEKTYDGVPLAITAEDCILKSGDLGNGYEYEIISLSSIDKVGEKKATFAVKIYKDGIDCTSHYAVAKKYGTLTLTAREIVVKAKDKEKVYDGKPLECKEIEYDSSVLADGDYIDSYVVEGSQTNYGKASNIVRRVVIKNRDGIDVTSNYIIKTEEGVLSVKPN